MHELDSAEFGGAERRFGTLEQTPEQLTCSYPVFGESDQTPPLIPENQWEPTWRQPGDNNDQFSAGIGDQEDQGACGAISGVELGESIQLKSGYSNASVDPTTNAPKFNKLSWGSVYWSVNGGADNGSLPESVLKHLSTVGAPAATVIPINSRKSGRNDPVVLASAAENVIEEWFLLPTVNHLVSAFLQGFQCHMSVWWYKNDNVNSAGWLSDRPTGKRGGHSIRGAEFIIENGVKGVRFPNTWTTRWGVQGYGKISLGRLADNMRVWPYWAVRSIRQKQGNFPQVKTAVKTTV